MRFWSERKVFVTGASGLVGSWLVSRLVEENASVVVLVRDADPQSELFRSGLINDITVVSGALESYDTLERALSEYEIDTVFHLGAQTIVGTAIKTPLVTFEANIRGTYNLLEACRRQGGCIKRIVIASSDKAYGASTVLPYTEHMPLMGRFPYDVSKSCCDLIAQSYFHTFSMPVTIARCGNIFGGGDLNWSRIIPGTIRSLLKEEAPIIRSDGSFIRDYIYVKDAVAAYMILAEMTERVGIKGEGFNFAPSKPCTVLEVVKALQTILKTNIRPRILNQAKEEIKDQFLTSKKAQTLLGWSPIYSLNEGLEETVEWYKNYLTGRIHALY